MLPRKDSVKNIHIIIQQNFNIIIMFNIFGKKKKEEAKPIEESKDSKVNLNDTQTSVSHFNSSL